MEFELGIAQVEIGGTNDINVLNMEDEFSFVGAGIGNNISNTKELKVMNYHEAMKSKDLKWKRSDSRIIIVFRSLSKVTF